MQTNTPSSPRDSQRDTRRGEEEWRSYMDKLIDRRKVPLRERLAIEEFMEKYYPLQQAAAEQRMKKMVTLPKEGNTKYYVDKNGNTTWVIVEKDMMQSFINEEKMKAIEELKFHLLNEETLQKKYPKLNKKHAKYKEEVALTNGYNWAITRLRVVLTEFKALSEMKSKGEEKE